MDVIEASILVAAWSGVVYGLLHFAGYIPRPYRARLARSEALLSTLPAQIGAELENALNRVAAQQEAKYAEAAEAAGVSDKMSLIRKVGVAKEEEKELLGMVAETVAGPVVEGLRIAWPDMADKLENLLETDPARAFRLWEIAQRIPWVQQNVLPRLKGMIGKAGGESPSPSDNPFLKDLGR